MFASVCEELRDAAHAFGKLRTAGRLETLIKSQRIRWADALSFGPEGWLYVADSALQDQVLMSKDHIAASGPYFIYRFQPGVEGRPGH